MLERSKEEIEADTVMLLIENIYDSQPTLIKHLYKMHRLRDQEFMIGIYMNKEVICGYEYWLRELEEMQTN